MDLRRVESQRSELLQFVLFLVILFLGFITYVSFREDQGPLVPVLAIVSLVACLYVIGKERRLKSLQTRLIEELTSEQKKSSELESRLKEITDLYRAISAVNSVSEPEYTFEAVLRAALDLVEANRGSIMLIDERDDHLRIVCAQGLPEHVVAQTRQKLGSGIAGWVAKQREPLLLSGEVREDPRFQALVEYEDGDLHYSMSIPLHLRGEGLGVLNLGVTEKAPKRKLTEHDLRMATVFAQHASVAIENARLRLAQLVRPVE